MLQLRNETPFAPRLFVFPDEEGVDTLYVALRATFEVRGGAARVAEKQPPVQLVDAPTNGPGSSLARASEAHLVKPSTDVVLVGEAWAPRGRPAPVVDVSCRVGSVSKVVRVFGERTWRAGVAGVTPGSAEPFTSIPLVYERAFGGVHRIDDERTAFEPKNPVGVGFLGERAPRELVGTPVPNLEDPRALLREPGDAPPPAGFGFVAPSWEPRRSFAGTYDDAWRRTRAPYLPADFDPRFFQAATPELVAAAPLQGGEPVEVLNASPEGPMRFTLPACPALVDVVIEGELEAPRLRLETVLLEPGEGTVSLTYRAQVRCDKRVLLVESVHVRPAGGRS